MYRRTGDKARGGGVYHSDCRCRTEVRIRKDEVFPTCPRCRKGVGWMFTRSLFAGGAGAPPRADDGGGRPA